MPVAGYDRGEEIMRMRIGELARRAGVHVQTVRYYERLKLLPAPERSASGYRSYEPTDLERVEFIRKTQEFGFSLEEIRQLARAHAVVMRCRPRVSQAEPELRRIVDMFERKRTEIAARIADLTALEGRLRHGIEQLGAPAPLCPGSTAPPRADRCPQPR
jgi:DNA-binding transcriptional MerR regulator